MRGRDPLDGRGTRAPAITAAGDTWAVVDTEDGDVWLRGADAAATGADDGHGRGRRAGRRRRRRLPRRRDGTRARRRRRIGASTTSRRRRHARCSARPRSPIVHDGEMFAAWLGTGDDGGRAVALERRRQPRSTTASETLGDERRPAFVASDTAVILNETRSGWAWTVPDGALVPSSQDWALDDRTDPDAVPSEEQLTVVHRPQAADRRAGRLRRARGEPRHACRC